MGESFLLLAILLLLVIAYLFVVTYFLPKFGVQSMPEDIQEKIMRMPALPKWKTVVGYIGVSVLALGFIGVLIAAGVLAVREKLSFGMIFARYLIILWGYKAFDIVCLDWFLITKTRFFQKRFPITENCDGYRQFGFNKKKQRVRIIAMPVISLVMAWILTWIAS